MVVNRNVGFANTLKLLILTGNFFSLNNPGFDWFSKF